jgi:adenylate cyclase
MDKRRRTALRSALLIGVVVSVVFLLGWGTGVFESWEERTRDARTRATLPAVGGHPDVAMIIITDDTLHWMATENGISWPWDREAFAYLYRACSLEKARAAAVLFDFFCHLDAAEAEPEWADAIRAAPPSWFATPFYEKPVKGADARADLEVLLDTYALDLDSDGSVKPPDRFLSVDLPRPALAASPSGICNVATPRDRDGIIRRYRLFETFRGRAYPSFALAGLMAREGARKVTVRDRVVTVGTVSVPVTADGCVVLRYYAPCSEAETFPLLAASRVIGGLGPAMEGEPTTFDPSDVAGKVVIMGITAAALTDLRVTPVEDFMPGSEVHATALANLLNGDFLREIPRGLAALVLVVLVVGTALASRVTSAVQGGLIVVGTYALYGTLGFLLYAQGWILDMAAPMGGVVVAYAWATTANFLEEGRRRQWTKEKFQRYISPKVVDKILKDPDAIKMEGERKPLTIFFMDFAGFTAMSETLDPKELVDLISQYHNAAAQEVFRTEGTVDKYIGDAIMAFWNDPVDQADHAARACLSALGAQEKLEIMAAEMKARGLPEMSARIGVNTGIATVGDMGAHGQANYTAIGDEVNLASRLEGVNKEFGTKILVSHATWEGDKDRVEGREVASVRVKGRKEPVRIHELLGLKGEVPPDRLEAARAFERAVGVFRERRWAEAREAFRALPPDGAIRIYLGLCDRYEQVPPPEDWDGAYQMTGK